jgi:hypothetical protein
LLARAHEGASTKDGWKVKRQGASASTDHMADASTLRARSRALTQNVPYIAQGLRCLVSRRDAATAAQVVACNLLASVRPTAAHLPRPTRGVQGAAVRQVEAIANEFCNRAQAARRGRLRTCVPCDSRQTRNWSRITPKHPSMATSPLRGPCLQCMNATPMLVQPAAEPYAAQ